MIERDLLVLICKDYPHKPNYETHVLDFPEAIKLLQKDGVSLSLYPDKINWGMGVLNVLRWTRIGSKCLELYVGPSSETCCYVGVYDRTQTSHMKSMVDAVLYKEVLRHPIKSAD